jgi:hypothetical protein
VEAVAVDGCRSRARAVLEEHARAVPERFLGIVVHRDIVVSLLHTLVVGWRTYRLSVSLFAVLEQLLEQFALVCLRRLV